MIECTCCSLKCHPSLRPIPQRATRRETRLNSQQRRLTLLFRESLWHYEGDITTLETQTFSLALPPVWGWCEEMDGWHFRLCTEGREGSRLVSNCSNWYLAPWLTGYKTNEIRIKIQGANFENWKLTYYNHIKNMDERCGEFIHLNTCIRVCKSIVCKITSLLRL